MHDMRQLAVKLLRLRSTLSCLLQLGRRVR